MSSEIQTNTLRRNLPITVKWRNYFMGKFVKFGYLERALNLVTGLFRLSKTAKFKLFVKRRLTKALIRRRRYRNKIYKLRLWGLYNPLDLLKQAVHVLRIFVVARYKRRGKIILHIPWPVRLLQQYKLGIHWLTDLFWKRNHPKVRYFTKGGRLKRLRSQHHKYSWRGDESIVNRLYKELRDILLNRRVRIIKRIRVFIYLLLTKHVNSLRHRW